MRHYQVDTVVHLDGERLPMIIDRETGLPVDIALEYLISNCRGKSPSTILRTAESIALALEWSKETLGNNGLIPRLLKGQILSAAEIYGLSEFLRASYKKNAGIDSPLIVCPESHYIRLQRVISFCMHLMAETASRIPLSDPRSIVINDRINLFWSALKELLPSRPVSSSEIKSLHPDHVAILLEVLDPAHPSNPFSNIDARIRNRCIVEVMFDTGIRPGELLNLRVQDIAFGNPTHINVVRRPHPCDDPRKIPASVKRKSRIIPIANFDTAAHLEQYIREIRPKLEARSKIAVPFVFISSDHGAPLSLRSVQKIFSKLRTVIPRSQSAPGVREIPLTPMSARHTFSNETEEFLEKQGLPEDERKHQLMALRGDSSPESSERYIKGTREKRAWKMMLTRQGEVFSNRQINDDDVPY